MADINAWNENADRENTITAAGGWVAPSESMYGMLPTPTTPRGGVIYYGIKFYPKQRSPIGGHPSRRRMMKRIRKQERELARVYARLREYERQRRDQARAKPVTVTYSDGKIVTYPSLDEALQGVQIHRYGPTS